MVKSTNLWPDQWRIQDFPLEADPVGKALTSDAALFSRNNMKTKKSGPVGRGGGGGGVVVNGVWICHSSGSRGPQGSTPYPCLN